MSGPSSTVGLCFASALSSHVEPSMAAEQVCEEVARVVPPGKADLAVAFVSGKHVESMGEISAAVRTLLGPAAFIAVSADGVLAGETELESRSGIALLTASLPGAAITPFAYRNLPHVKPEDPATLEAMARAIGAERDLRAVFFFGDPFSVSPPSIVEAFSALPRVVPGLKRVPVFGGMASASPMPGGNVLALNDAIYRVGAVGFSVRGDVSVGSLVSQGCRPIGKPLVVTGAQRNILKTLGGRRAMDVLRDTVTALGDAEKPLLANGIFVGRVIDEYKDRFGRGDFLIRGIMGVDQQSGAIAVGDMLRVGQTIQFHIRDAATAAEDLELLLAKEQLDEPAAGGLLFTCNGRGTRLFAEAGHDARAITRALRTNDGSMLPLAGFFAAGEIGPIGPSSFLHGHTASLALFRPKRRDLGE